MNDIFAAVEPGIIARTAYLKCVISFSLAFVYQVGPKLSSLIWTSLVCAFSAVYTANAYIKGTLPTACDDLKDPTRCDVFARLFNICFKVNMPIAGISLTETQAITGGNSFFERFIKCLSAELTTVGLGINDYIELVINPTKNTVLPTTEPTPAPTPIDPLPNP
jgi:hypothetical protein